MSENKKSDIAPLILVGAIMVVVAVNKYQFQLIGLYLKYRLLICFFLAVCVVGFYYFIKSKLFKSTPETTLIDQVTNIELGEDAVFAGISDVGKKVYLRHQYRRMHAQVIGTTNAGKTESVVVPWAVDDMKRGRGLVIIDGKSDRTLLNKIYAYARKYRREEDVRVLSICDVGISHSFNPLKGGTPLEITERVFAAFTFENEYYKNLQYEALLQSLLIFEGCKIIPTPLRLIEFFRSPAHIKYLSAEAKLKAQSEWASEFLSLSRDEREQRTSGLLSQLQAFSVGETSCLFNVEKPEIDLERALEENQIIYCQLPAMRLPTLGKATGKLVLQCLQGAISSRHLGKTENREHFSIYLDDFTEYLTPSFVTMLNKSRSANVSITFAHQAIGDLAVLGDAVKNSILTNANLKVIMRSNDPETAEYFASVVGTKESAKVTERQKTHTLGTTKTGEGSVREAEEYKVHPNEFKQSMGLGNSVLIIPHQAGSVSVKVTLAKLPDLDPPVIEIFNKPRPLGLSPVPTDDSEKIQYSAGPAGLPSESVPRIEKLQGVLDTQERRSA